MVVYFPNISLLKSIVNINNFKYQKELNLKLPSVQLDNQVIYLFILAEYHSFDPTKGKNLTFIQILIKKFKAKVGSHYISNKFFHSFSTSN